MAVAQLARAPGCGPGGRGFETPRSPQEAEHAVDGGGRVDAHDDRVLTASLLLRAPCRRSRPPRSPAQLDRDQRLAERDQQRERIVEHDGSSCSAIHRSISGTSFGAAATSWSSTAGSSRIATVTSSGTMVALHAGEDHGGGGRILREVPLHPAEPPPVPNRHQHPTHDGERSERPCPRTRSAAMFVRGPMASTASGLAATSRRGQLVRVLAGDHVGGRRTPGRARPAIRSARRSCSRRRARRRDARRHTRGRPRRRGCHRRRCRSRDARLSAKDRVERAVELRMRELEPALLAASRSTRVDFRAACRRARRRTRP